MFRYASILSYAIGSVRSNLQRYSHSVCKRSFLLSPPEMAEIIDIKRSTISRLCSIILILILIKLKLYITLQNIDVQQIQGIVRAKVDQVNSVHIKLLSILKGLQYQNIFSVKTCHQRQLNLLFASFFTIIIVCLQFQIIQLSFIRRMSFDNLFSAGLSALTSRRYVFLNDDQVIPHISNMLASIKKTKSPQDIIHLSNIVKQTQPRTQHQKNNIHEVAVAIPHCTSKLQNKDFILRKYSIDSQKLQWAGHSLSKQEVALIDGCLLDLSERNKVKEIRFWGRILGTYLDYYVIQGIAGEINALEDVSKGSEKRGEGVNYYTFWVTNNLISPEWIELPLITPQHIKTARKIKNYFTGHLERPVLSEPPFEGSQKHLLKAQLVRMTNSLQIVPKGIFKPNDDNPKIVEYEQEPKIPEFAELSALQSWVHRNPNILNLGRCTHYIDPSLPEDQIEAVTAELAEKDPELERLRGLTEDKLPEGSPFGVENIWQIRVAGDTQVFQKDEGSSVYAAVTIKNVYWPGWVTVASKSGYVNHYVGYGLKWTQPAWNNYENVSLAEEAEDVNEFPEPNPKEEPKPPAAEPVAEQPQEQ